MNLLFNQQSYTFTRGKVGEVSCPRTQRLWHSWQPTLTRWPSKHWPTRPTTWVTIAPNISIIYIEHIISWLCVQWMSGVNASWRADAAEFERLQWTGQMAEMGCPAAAPPPNLSALPNEHRDTAVKAKEEEEWPERWRRRPGKGSKKLRCVKPANLKLRNWHKLRSLWDVYVPYFWPECKIKCMTNKV